MTSANEDISSMIYDSSLGNVSPSSSGSRGCPRGKGRGLDRRTAASRILLDIPSEKQCSVCFDKSLDSDEIYFILSLISFEVWGGG